MGISPMERGQGGSEDVFSVFQGVFCRIILIFFKLHVLAGVGTERTQKNPNLDPNFGSKNLGFEQGETPGAASNPTRGIFLKSKMDLNPIFWLLGVEEPFWNVREMEKIMEKSDFYLGQGSVEFMWFVSLVRNKNIWTLWLLSPCAQVFPELSVRSGLCFIPFLSHFCPIFIPFPPIFGSFPAGILRLPTAQKNKNFIF